MKARRRVVTGPAGSVPTKRRPTIRTIKPALGPSSRPSGQRPGPARPGAPAGAAAGRRSADPGVESAPERAHQPLAADRPIELAVEIGRGLRFQNPVVAAA